MKKEKFSLNSRFKSFKYAFNGLKILIKEEHNSRIHFLIALCVVIAGILFKVSLIEWIALVFAIGLVISLEVINTVIENIANFICPEKNEKIKKIKDLGAAGVLIGAITAIIIGLIIFIPKIV